jgi:hypothetical protein
LEKKKPKPVQTDRFRFGSVIFGKKPVQTSLAWFFPVWLGFSCFGSVFFQLGLVFLRFGFSSVFSVSGL